jgi:hypothetical protein
MTGEERRSGYYTLMAVAAIATWLIVLTEGVAIDSERLIDGNAMNGLLRLPAILISETWTNVAILACLSAMIANLSKSPSRVARVLTTGFLIYLLVMGGQSILGSSAGPDVKVELTQQIGQHQYLRIAATVSLLSFLAVYDPKLLGHLVRLPLTFLDPADGNKVAGTRRTADHDTAVIVADGSDDLASSS